MSSDKLMPLPAVHSASVDVVPSATEPIVHGGNVPETLRSRTVHDVALGSIELLRLPQWLKNGFVLAPLLFAGRLAHGDSLRQSLWAFLAFCLLSSTVYILNDVLDRKSDRLHPRKATRPIPSGTVSVTAAAMLGITLLSGSFLIAYTKTNTTVVLLQAAYLLINVGYSTHLKHVIILDAFSIASGFVIRVWVGAFAIAVPASHWLILCTFLLALFLAFTKRQSELSKLGTNAAVDHRRVLSLYSHQLITQMNLVVLSAAIVCYALYTVAPETVEKFGTDRLVYSVPFVVYGLFRYFYLSQQKQEGDSPSVLVVHDRPLLLCLALWILFCVITIYSFGGPHES